MSNGGDAGHFTVPTHFTDINEAWIEVSESDRGSGGGAGGSISMIMRNLKGNGVVSI